MRQLSRLRRQRQCPDSLFLNLPAEIRNQIYSAALISPSPIDLCPANYAYNQEDIEANAVMQQRSLAFEKSDNAKVVHELNRPTKVAFRLQSSLQYVRQHLVVQLLSVCCQIYNEAVGYFWSANVWRFTEDEDWEILLRFLLTIGPSATSRIERLEALAPRAWKDIPILPEDKHWQVKNQPKLHMVKLWEDERRHDVVWELLMRERSLGMLNLLVPAGYELRSMSGWIRWESRHWDEIFMRWLAETRVVVESAGVLLCAKSILQQGWDITALPGSRVLEILAKDVVVPMNDLDVTDRAQSWESDVDHLTGVMQLFELEEVSVHANGGRVNNAKTKKKGMERVLKGFGPCMICVESVPCDCLDCVFEYRWRWDSEYRPRMPCYRSLVDRQEKEELEWLRAFNI